MKGRVLWWLSLVLFGAWSATAYAQSYTGYLQVGSVVGELAGHRFYVATGEVHLYRVGYLGNQSDTGQQVESAAAVRVDSATGRVLKIVTLQPNGSGGSGTGSSAENSATVAGGQEYVVSDLLGGIQVSDIEPYGTWLDAIQAMKQAIVQLNAVGQFSPGGNIPPVVVGQPQVVVQPPPVVVSPPIIQPPPVYAPPPFFAAPPPPDYYPPPVYGPAPPGYFPPPPTYVAPPPAYVPPPPAYAPPPVVVDRPPPMRMPPPFGNPGPPTIWRQPQSVPVMPGANVGGR